MTKRFRMLVTVRDLRGKTVRHAIVSVTRVPRVVNTISGTHSAFSNKAGKATGRRARHEVDARQAVAREDRRAHAKARVR